MLKPAIVLFALGTTALVGVSSTFASGHTDPQDWAGLNAAGTTNPSGVPGVQVDGYFPDTSTSNTHHGWNHDS